MAAPGAQSAGPGRSRIVINVDQGRQATHPARRKSRRWLKILGAIALVFTIILLAIAALGFLGWRRYQTTPAYSLALLIDAARRDDNAAFDEIFDAEQVTNNMVAQVTEKIAGQYAGSIPPPLRKQIEAAVARRAPALKQKVRDDAMQQTKAIAERVKNMPFLLYALGISSALESSAQENDTARVTFKRDDRPVALTMQRNGARWKIISMQDDQATQRIADSFAQDIKLFGKGLEGDVRERIRRALPGLKLPGDQ
jgi:hypothetical protein